MTVTFDGTERHIGLHLSSKIVLRMLLEQFGTDYIMKT